VHRHPYTQRAPAEAAHFSPSMMERHRAIGPSGPLIIFSRDLAGLGQRFKPCGGVDACVGPALIGWTRQGSGDSHAEWRPVAHPCLRLPNIPDDTNANPSTIRGNELRMRECECDHELRLQRAMHRLNENTTVWMSWPISLSWVRIKKS